MIQLKLTWEAVGVFIAAIFSLLSFIGGILNFFKSNRDRKSNLKISYISDKRRDWIYEVRNVISEFISLATEIADKKKHQEIEDIEQFRYLNMITCKIRLLLNYSDQFDNHILEIINNICENILTVEKYNEIILSISYLTDLMQIYIKCEWERIKQEIDETKITMQWKNNTINHLLTSRIESEPNDEIKSKLKNIQQKMKVS